MPKKELSLLTHKYDDDSDTATSAVSSPMLDQLAVMRDINGVPLNGKRISHPNQLLLTLLGDYWWRRTEHLPSASLVALLQEFGVSDVAARAALSRLVQRDLLVPSKHGRQTFYGLSKRTAHILDDGTDRIFSFGEGRQTWDEKWSLVAFSVPEERRNLRHMLRDRLRWLGFAPLYDGLWVSPHDRLNEVARSLSELSIHGATMFRATIVEETPEAGVPQHAWDLDALREQYQQFIAEVQPLWLRTGHGAVSSEEALIWRTYIMNTWRRFPLMDPDLPDVLLPPDWPRTLARQLFIDTYDALGPLAQQRVQQIIARYAPELASYASYHGSVNNPSMKD